MKRARIGMMAIVALSVATLSFAQAKPDFSGTWAPEPPAGAAAGGGAPGGGGPGGGGGGGGGGRRWRRRWSRVRWTDDRQADGNRTEHRASGPQRRAGDDPDLQARRNAEHDHDGSGSGNRHREVGWQQARHHHQVGQR